MDKSKGKELRPHFIYGAVILVLMVLLLKCNKDEPIVKENPKVAEAEAKLVELEKESAKKDSLYNQMKASRDSAVVELKVKRKKDDIFIDKKYDKIENNVISLSDSASVEYLRERFGTE